jgi:hypothetical protein
MISMYWRNYSDVAIVSEYDTAGPGEYGRIINYSIYVETSDGRRFERDDRQAAIALATLFEVFDELHPSEQKEGYVPLQIALKGKPAIATYLIGVRELSEEEVAEVMQVKPPTVRKYLSRFKPYTKS